MTQCDDFDAQIPTHRRAAVRRGARARRGQHVGTPYERPRLRLVSSRQPAAGPFGMHPALPATLAFAALSVTALAVATVIDVVNAVAGAASTVGTQLGVARSRY